MPLTFVTSSTTTQTLDGTDPSSPNEFLMLPTETIAASVGDGILLTGLNRTNLTVDGYIAGSDQGVQVFLDSSINTSSLTIGESGTIFGASEGIWALQGNVTVHNYGEIFGSQGIVTGTNGFMQLLNHGTITASGNTNAVAIGVRPDPFGPLDLSVNYGTISGERGVSIYAVTGGVVTTRFDNYGTLIGTDESAFVAYQQATFFRNFGEVTGHVLTENMGDNTFHNHGTVGGDFSSLDGVDTVLNTGLFDGDIYLGAGNDVFRGVGGTVTGTVFGEAGNDTFYVDQADVLIDGGADFDTVNTRADFVSAGGNEVITLRGSDNIDATGDDLANVINGNNGNNILIGGLGADSIQGSSGDDTLSGGDENDRLRGGNGEDVLNGGAGRDDMFGGLGADVFAFTDTTHSGTTGATRDRIFDFQAGVDLINLQSLSDPDFTFEGLSGLSGTGPSVSYTDTGGNRLIVRIDADGDGTEDLQLLVIGAGALTAEDFLL